MHDIKAIRDNPEAFDAGLKKRGLSPQSADILALDAEMRKATQAFDEVKAEANALNADIGKAGKSGDVDRLNELKSKGAEFKERLATLEAAPGESTKKRDDVLAGLPNLPANDVPDGADETANVELKRWGTPRRDHWIKDHVDVGAPLGLDFETAQGVSGARFAYLRHHVARLNRAIAQFMLDTHVEKFGYQEVNPPLLVRDEAFYGTAQLPKFAEDSFQTTDGRWLIPTAEVSLTNIVREKIMSEKELPFRFTALTPCFRSEAGSAGRDTRGLIRQHQFEKVELVSITAPDQSEAEHERMTSCAEHILEVLGLPYRRMILCSGDMGFSARKTFDLEVWLPGQGMYREISSCSNCGDFQARRMNARFRTEGEKGTTFAHTLNGSALAVGRTLVAVLENYQNENGSVTVPEALRPYMRGLEVLSA